MTFNEKSLAVLDKATSLYQMAGRSGEDPCPYFLERGLSPQTIDAFRLGFAPYDANRIFLDKMRPYSDDDMLDAGLLKDKDGSFEYRFEGRYMIPIFDKWGRIVSLAGRSSLPTQKPKYVNGSNTSVFTKSEHLYGFHHASQAIMDTQHIVLVEGYLDVLQAYDKGYRNTVGLMGVELLAPKMKDGVQLDHQARQIVYLLRSMKVDRVTIALDGDVAGIMGIIRAYYLLTGVTKRARIDFVTLEDADPDDVIRENKQQWGRTVEKASSDFVSLGHGLLDKFETTDKKFKPALIGRAIRAVYERTLDIDLCTRASSELGFDITKTRRTNVPSINHIYFKD